MTFRQALELNAHVRKGERGSTVTDAETGEETEQNISFLKSYTVFNVEQTEGLAAHFHAIAEPRLDPVQRIERAESFFANTKADIRHGGNMAYYNLESDFVQTLPFDAFRDAESYYASLAHESAHRTRHQSRLDRNLERKRWSDAGYAMEELVAELGSAFLCADFDLIPALREDHAAYIANWLEVLKNDKRAIFSAAAHAQKPADYLTGLQAKESEPAAALSVSRDVRTGGADLQSAPPVPNIRLFLSAADSLRFRFALIIQLLDWDKTLRL
jgi:antirestriction protein ArdC